VTRHFLYFAACTTRNLLTRQVRRLRNPRYAVAGLVGLAYFYFLFGGWLGGNGADDPMGVHYVNAARALGPLALGVLSAWWWLWGGHRRALVLTPAEAHLLVPAPLTRRELVRFKILQAQAPILLSAGIGAMITRGAPLPWPLRLLSLWVLLATLHQHQIAASLVHAAAGEQGRHGVRRQAVPMTLFAAGSITVGYALARAVLDIRAAGSLHYGLERLAALMSEPAPAIVLAPFRLVLAPLLATSAEAWLAAVLPAVLVLAAHYVWVQRTDARFEEAAAAAGAERAARVAAVNAGGPAFLQFSRTGRPRRLAPSVLPLPGWGPPAYAILWKNLLYARRAIRPAALLILLVGVGLIILPLLASSSSPAQAFVRAGVACLAIGAFVTLAGPLGVRNDLRMDLRYVESLRTLPLSGSDLVAAEITAAVAAVTVLQMPLVLAGILLLCVGGLIPAGHAAAAAAVALPGLPALNALSVTAQNALALLYPGWVRIGDHYAGGMETVGQNLLTLVGTVLLLAIAAVPPLLAAAAVGAPLLLVSAAIALPAALAAALAAVAGEVLLCTRWLGRLYDRLDPVTTGLIR
jgi:ABC-2 type transport system permease protein